jgi:hypothetical protein
MPTVVSFSGTGDDYIVVEEDLDQVAKTLDHRTGLIKLTRLPTESQHFKPTPTWVNPARVAFLSHSERSR